MLDLTLSAPPPRPELLGQLRRRLAAALPDLRLVAEDLLGAEAPIDLLGVEGNGRAVVVLLGEAGRDLELVALGLAQRAWVAARLRDWVQLAPQLGLRPDLGPGVILLCPSFRPEALAAVRALPARELRPFLYRCVRNGQGFDALVEPLDAGPATRRAPPAEGRLVADRLEPFRTGISDADLGLSAEEIREFE